MKYECICKCGRDIIADKKVVIVGDDEEHLCLKCGLTENGYTEEFEDSVLEADKDYHDNLPNQ